MASYTTTFSQRFRRAISAVGIGVAPAATTVDSSVPTITSGAGAPTATAANGSIYLRTDGSDADESLYMRIGGSWAPILGETA